MRTLLPGPSPSGRKPCLSVLLSACRVFLGKEATCRKPGTACQSGCIWGEKAQSGDPSVVAGRRAPAQWCHLRVDATCPLLSSGWGPLACVQRCSTHSVLRTEGALLTCFLGWARCTVLVSTLHGSSSLTLPLTLWAEGGELGQCSWQVGHGEAAPALPSRRAPSPSYHRRQRRFQLPP